MSSNFHNLWGMHLVGLEFHDYTDAAGMSYSCHPHATGQFWFLQSAATLWKRAPQVTAEGWSMLQQGYDFYLVPHCPLPFPPPGPASVNTLGGVIITSGSKCQMAVLSVTSGGNPLACCIASAFSANQNCSDPIDVEFNAVMNLNSVETSPTPGDYAAAVVSGIVDKLMGFAVGRAGEWGTKPLKNEKLHEPLVEVLEQVWRRAPDVITQIEQYTTIPTSEFVKQMVDGDGT